MEKIKEFIDYKNIPGQKIEIKNFNTTKKEVYFTFYTFFYENEKINVNTINSIINQTFTDFSWIIICNDTTYKKCNAFLKEIDIKDSRIKIIKYENFNIKVVKENSNAKYFLPIQFDTYVDKTYLETIYYNIKFYGEKDIYYSNVISIQNEKAVNESLVSKRKRLINFSNKTFCIKKDKLESIKEENDVIKLSGKNDIVHLNYYGVWQEKVIKNIINLDNGEFINYPSSSLYNFTTTPTKNTILIDESKKEKTILCLMPWSKIGGADIFNYNVLKYLNEKGFNIIVVTTEYCPYEARQNMEEIVSAYYDLTTFLKREEWANFIKSIIINKDVKLIFQLSSLYCYYLIPWLKYQFPELPIVDYVHAEDFAWRNGGFPKDSTAIANFLDKTLVCNNHVKNLMYEKMNRKVQNVDTLYIGVDTEKYNPNKVEIADKETLNFCKDKKVILFPSRFSAEKRPIFLLNVMKEIKKKRKDIVCIMVGGGPFKNDIDNYIKNNNLEDIVRVLPMQTNILQYYKLANLTIICSLSEGITLTTYESLAMNTPVLTADVGGQKEVITNSVGGVIKKYQDIKKDLFNFNYSKEEIAEYEEYIYNILDNNSYYTKNEKCRNIVLNGFSQKKLFESIENYFNELIKNKSKFDSKQLTNEEFAGQYLVLFNETSKVYYNNSLEFDDLKGYIKNKLWQKWWYRLMVKLAKKLKIDIIIKKIYFRRK